MFSGILVVVFLVLLLCRRVVWQGLCFLIGHKLLKKSANTGEDEGGVKYYGMHYKYSILHIVKKEKYVVVKHC